MPRNLKIMEVAYGQELSPLEREWLYGHLGSLRGISKAVCHREGARCLLIEFDDDLITTVELVDYLCFCGISPELPPPIPDEWQMQEDDPTTEAA